MKITPRTVCKKFDLSWQQWHFTFDMLQKSLKRLTGRGLADLPATSEPMYLDSIMMSAVVETLSIILTT